MNNDSVRDTRGGDFAWFHRSFLEMKLGWKANLVYMGLVTFANGQTQQCFPSKGTLAELLGISKTTVFEGLNALEAAKIVRVDRRKDGANQLTNEYILLPPPMRNTDTPMRNTNGGGTQYASPPMRNTNPNEKNINKKDFNQKNLTNTPLPPSGEECESLVEACFNAYPNQANPIESRVAVRRVLKNLTERFGDVSAGGSWMLGRICEYASSASVVGTPPRYIPSLASWIRKGKYDEDSTVWAIPRSPSTTNADFLDERAQLARII